MAGFSEYFSVNEGSPILKHPLYLQFNTINIGDLELETLRNALAKIMATNENMGIIWYLSNLIEARNRIGG